MNDNQPTYKELEEEIALLRQEIEESNAKFKAYTAQSPVAIYTTNTDGDCIYANKTWLAMSGMQLDEALGKGWMNALHPDDLEYVNKNWYQSVESDGKWRFEYRFINKKKEITWVEGTAKELFNDKKERIGYLGTNVDITTRKKTEETLKESEESFREMFRNMGYGVCRYSVIDGGEDFIFKNINTAGEKIAHVKRSDILGKSILDIRPKSKEYGLIDVFKKVWKTGKSEVYKESFYQDESLSGYYQNYVYKLSSGDIVAIFQDLTESKKAEEVLLESERQQKELNATKDKLISIISHDLRSPFNSIIGLAELMTYSADHKDLEETESLAAMINTTAKSTLGLLDNLLTWARSQTGHMKVSPVSLNLKAIVTEVIDLLQPTASFKNISLKEDISMEDLVYVDEDMLKTILRNLISNAIKFTDTNGKIDIHAIRKKNFIEIHVSDNGMGMDKDNQDKLFQIDQHSTNRGTANEIGSGLGLLICKEFVNLNGGQIWVESVFGEGSVFKFTIPIQNYL